MKSTAVPASPMSGKMRNVPSPMPLAAAQLGTLVRCKRWLALNWKNIVSAVLGLIAIAAAFLVWQLLTAAHVDFYVRFENVPTPGAVLDRFRSIFFTSTFGIHIGASVRRISIGFLIAAAVAIPLGLFMGRFAFVRATVFPVTELLRPIPAIAWVPMAIMIWPTSEESILFITFIGSFFPILVNTLHGVEKVDPVLVRAARCLGAKEAALFTEVYLPGALPDIFTGLTVGMGSAWISLIAAEMISGQYGIGYFTWQAYSLVDYPDIVLGMITIGALGLGFSWLIRIVGIFLMPWRAAR